MSTDYAAKEREFLDSLKADTGRDLDQWMAAIRAEGLPHRNDIIDWLRQQGFMFSRASWLERIHNNGGKPIYAGQQTASRRPAPRQSAPRPTTPRQVRPFPRASAAPSEPSGGEAGETTADPASQATEAAAAMPDTPGNKQAAPELHAAPPRPGPPRLVVVPPSAPPPGEPPPPGPAAPMPPRAVVPATADGLQDVLAKAKAYRPLAQYLLREIEKAVPGCVTTVRDGLISIGHPQEFAVVQATYKDVRLGLDLGEHADDARVSRTRIVGATARISHTMVLTDARQIDPALIALIRAADLNANGRPGH